MRKIFLTYAQHQAGQHHDILIEDNEEFEILVFRGAKQVFNPSYNIKPRSKKLRGVISLAANEALEVVSQRNKIQRSNHRKLTAALLSELAYQSILHRIKKDDAPAMLVSRSTASKSKRDRYVPSFVGRSRVKTFDGLWQSLWIGQLIGKKAEHSTTATELTVGPKLKQAIDELDVTLDDFTITPECELIVLKKSRFIANKGKGKHGPQDPIPYADNHETRYMRRSLKAYNSFIKQQDITSSHPEYPAGKRYLKRIFNRGNFQYGGRFYGAFWETMPKVYRFNFIRINDKPVMEVDFTAMHLNLAAADSGAPLEAYCTGDPYDWGNGFVREYVKLLTITMINAPTLPVYPSALSKEMFEGRSFNDVKQLAYRYLPFLRNCKKDDGLRYQRMDSDIMNNILSDAVSSELVALPLHDGVICASSSADDLKVIMERRYLEYVGFKCEAVINEGHPKDKLSETDR